MADAVAGAPVAKAEVEFFGWQQKWIQPNHIDIRHQAIRRVHRRRRPVADGSAAAAGQDYQWLVIARSKEGRFAYLGFSNIWYGAQYDAEYNETKVFPITDRPVYRPEQAVKYKFWVEHAQYDQADTSAFAGQPFTIEIHNPKGEKVVSVDGKADAYGGLEGEYKLPADADAGRLLHGSPAGRQVFRAAAASASRSTRSPSSR